MTNESSIPRNDGPTRRTPSRRNRGGIWPDDRADRSPPRALTQRMDHGDAVEVRYTILVAADDPSSALGI